MRDVSTVIDCMVVHIPKEEANFINALMSIKESSKFTAPESMSERYLEVSYCLYDYIKEMSLSSPLWQKVVCTIFSTDTSLLYHKD